MSAPTLTARLAACYTGAVHDVLRMMGHDNIVLPPAIKAIAPGTRLAGPVWTVSGHIDRTRSRHETLLGWCTLLARAPSGHVIVCQPHNHEVALMGELSAQTLQARGVLGYVVDGGSRDTDLVLEQGFPVFCSFLTPSDIVERWIPDRYGEPVTIGTVTVSTGDYLLGDRDGVVIIPARAGRRRHRQDRGSGVDRDRDAQGIDRRHGSGRRVRQVRKILDVHDARAASQIRARTLAPAGGLNERRRRQGICRRRHRLHRPAVDREPGSSGICGRRAGQGGFAGATCAGCASGRRQRAGRGILRDSDSARRHARPPRGDAASRAGQGRGVRPRGFGVDSRDDRGRGRGGGEAHRLCQRGPSRAGHARLHRGARRGRSPGPRLRHCGHDPAAVVCARARTLLAVPTGPVICVVPAASHDTRRRAAPGTGDARRDGVGAGAGHSRAARRRRAHCRRPGDTRGAQKRLGFGPGHRPCILKRSFVNSG